MVVEIWETTDGLQFTCSKAARLWDSWKELEKVIDSPLSETLDQRAEHFCWVVEHVRPKAYNKLAVQMTGA